MVHLGLANLTFFYFQLFSKVALCSDEKLFTDFWKDFNGSLNPLLDVLLICLVDFSQFLYFFGLLEDWQKLWCEIDVFDEVSCWLLNLSLVNHISYLGLSLEVDGR